MAIRKIPCFRYLIWAVAICWLSATGCHSDKTQPSSPSPIVVASFYVRYLDDTRQIRPEASFSELGSDGKSIPKRFENVVFYGSPLSEKDFGNHGIRYLAEIEGEVDKEYFFEFWNKDFDKTKVPVSLTAVGRFAFEGNVSKSKGATLKFQGLPFVKKESLVLIFTGEGNQSASIEVFNFPKPGEVSIRPESLAAVANGKNQVYLVRKNSSLTKTSSQEWNLQTEFYSKSITVNVVD